MTAELKIDRGGTCPPPASPVVEATLSLIHELVRDRLGTAAGDDENRRLRSIDAGLETADFERIVTRILGTGYRFDWSAGISAAERPDIYRNSGSDGLDDCFSHPDAVLGEADAAGWAACGSGDNVVRHAGDIEGTARFIRTNQRVLGYLTEGVPPGTIAIIDDSGGTLTAPIIEQFAGVICAGGTIRSHLGILTREYNIPCLMNARITGISEGDLVRIEASAEAKKTEDYQQGIERIGRVWRRDGEQAA